MVGRLVAAAAFLYRKLCIKIGRTIAMVRVIRMVEMLGDRAAVSQLSLSCHAMAVHCPHSHRQKNNGE
jgi:hypothetical protein